MIVEDVDAPRFRNALELFREGKSLTFEGVDYVFAPDGALAVYVHSSWQIGNTDDQRALRDLARARSNLDFLISASPEFELLVRGKERRFSLIFFDGRDSVEIARFDGDSINWL